VVFGLTWKIKSEAGFGILACRLPLAACRLPLAACRFPLSAFRFPLFSSAMPRFCKRHKLRLWEAGVEGTPTKEGPNMGARRFGYFATTK
jgi:hypothetical protein